MMDKKVSFRYFPNIYDDEAVSHDRRICECCGKETDAYVSSMYCVDEVECICLNCVADGSAAKKFDGTFVQDAMKISDSEKTKELFERTPGYLSWQGEYWLACCDDYCEFLGTVGTEELEKMGIADEVFEEYISREDDADVRKYLVKNGSTNGYLFRCLHCKKYHLGVDCD